MLTMTEVSTPEGEIKLVAKGHALAALVFHDGWPGMKVHLERRFGVLSFAPSFPETIARRVRAYLAGDLGALDAIAIDVEGTHFQKRVWEELRSTRAGETLSYQELARRIGSPNAVRAVGTANGANPVCIVVPCHRIIRADGSLGGYGGGLARKRWLLAHEGITTPWSASASASAGRSLAS